MPPDSGGVILGVMHASKKWAPALIVTVAAFGQPSDGTRIAADPDLFSAAVRTEFTNMNETFGNVGFELQVFERAPTLRAITARYGDPDREETIEVMRAGAGDDRRTALTVFYYGDIGFAVLPDDPEQVVLRIKRRAQ